MSSYLISDQLKVAGVRAPEDDFVIRIILRAPSSKWSPTIAANIFLRAGLRFGGTNSSLPFPILSLANQMSTTSQRCRNANGVAMRLTVGKREKPVSEIVHASDPFKNLLQISLPEFRVGVKSFATRARLSGKILLVFEGGFLSLESDTVKNSDARRGQ